MSFLAALSFLTRVPVPTPRSPSTVVGAEGTDGGGRSDGGLAAAAPWFPVVGGLVGGVAGGVGALAAGQTGWLTAAVLVVVVEVLLTGALHLDGLADTADGLGVAGRERRLAVMKDHATGVFGVAAVVLALLLEVALLTGLLAGLPGWSVVAVCAAAGAASRAAMLPLALTLPYARAEGTGRSLVAGLTPARTVVAAGVSVVLSLLAGVVLAWGPAGQAALLPVLGALAGVALLVGAVCVWARRSLGGVTGDVLGATAQLSVLTYLLVLTLLA